MVSEVVDGVFLLEARKPGCHSYLIKGEQLNVLIDPGLGQHLGGLRAGLRRADTSLSDIDVVINTHEHFDHIGANKHLQNAALIAAHRYAAAKMISGDDEVTMCRANGQRVDGYMVHLWMENINLIDAGGRMLKVIHTPGHTSGCVCIYEPRGKVLFSGDTVFARGTVSEISKSGSYGEYLNSLRRLNTMKIDLILPGHGEVSEEPEDDLSQAIKGVESELKRIARG